MMINIELIYASGPKSWIYHKLSVEPNSSIKQVIKLANIKALDLALMECTVGIWSKAADLSDLLKEGDRIEIYRPLVYSALKARELRKQQTQDLLKAQTRSFSK